MLREADARLGVMDRMGGCFSDRHHPGRSEHEVRHLVARRVYGVALGYEDLNDHDELRSDALPTSTSPRVRRGPPSRNPGTSKASRLA